VISSQLDAQFHDTGIEIGEGARTNGHFQTVRVQKDNSKT